jgi:hypothetical protein
LNIFDFVAGLADMMIADDFEADDSSFAAAD